MKAPGPDVVCDCGLTAQLSPPAPAQPEKGEWKIKRDPAAPTWPGMLVVNEKFGSGFLKVVAGDPPNFRDSDALAERIVAALRSPSGGEAERRRWAIEDQINTLLFAYLDDSFCDVDTLQVEHTYPDDADPKAKKDCYIVRADRVVDGEDWNRTTLREAVLADFNAHASDAAKAEMATILSGAALRSPPAPQAEAEPTEVERLRQSSNDLWHSYQKLVVRAGTYHSRMLHAEAALEKLRHSVSAPAQPEKGEAERDLFGIIRMLGLNDNEHGRAKALEFRQSQADFMDEIKDAAVEQIVKDAVVARLRIESHDWYEHYMAWRKRAEEAEAALLALRAERPHFTQEGEHWYCAYCDQEYTGRDAGERGQRHFTRTHRDALARRAGGRPTTPGVL